MRNSKSAIRNQTRHGMTALLAMLYLALLASLAVGFYASSNSAAMGSLAIAPHSSTGRSLALPAAITV